MEKNKEKIIVVKNLTVKYGLKQQPIIKNFNLEIDSGDSLSYFLFSGKIVLETSISFFSFEFAAASDILYCFRCILFMSRKICYKSWKKIKKKLF